MGIEILHGEWNETLTDLDIVKRAIYQLPRFMGQHRNKAVLRIDDYYVVVSTNQLTIGKQIQVTIGYQKSQEVMMVTINGDSLSAEPPGALVKFADLFPAIVTAMMEGNSEFGRQVSLAAEKLRLVP